MNSMFKIVLLFGIVAVFSSQLAQARPGHGGGHSGESGTVCTSANVGAACTRRNAVGVCALNVETRYVNGVLVSTQNKYYCNATTTTTTAATSG